MQAPSEEEEFHSVSLLFSFKLFVPNRPLFSLLILLFSAKTPEGRPRGCMCGIPNFSLQTSLHRFKKLCCCVHASGPLTCCVALHLNYTF